MALKDRDARRAYEREYRLRPDKWRGIKLTEVKANAKRKGIEFTITQDDLYLPERCPILDTPLIQGSKREEEIPSIDRVDNTKGYIPGNVRVISMRANAMKRDLSVDMLKRILRYVEEHFHDGG